MKKPLASPSLPFVSWPTILYEIVLHSFVQKCFSSPSVSFPALVSSTFKARKENAFKGTFAAPEMNLFCSSIQKYSPKEDMTAAPSQAAWWAASHLWLPTCPGSQAAAWKCRNPRPMVAHLAEQPKKPPHPVHLTF